MYLLWKALHLVLSRNETNVASTGGGDDGDDDDDVVVNTFKHNETPLGTGAWPVQSPRIRSFPPKLPASCNGP